MYFFFPLPTTHTPTECLRNLAAVLELFVDMFEAPDKSGNGDPLNLSALGAKGGSIILASIEQGIREVANDLDGEPWGSSCNEDVQAAVFNRLARYLVEYVTKHEAACGDLVAFFRQAMDADFTDWPTLMPLVRRDNRGDDTPKSPTRKEKTKA